MVLLGCNFCLKGTNFDNISASDVVTIENWLKATTKKKHRLSWYHCLREQVVFKSNDEFVI
ncbi:hypothetical protein AGMMS49950_09260 [Endomicrobiia bacterium]|nr:hypothetical protein AGMMS49531_09870 [Endomicrobiia bacterium]GHT71851.1 hypothetical protein AGMMS49950_09260 [Endomicrobiia bacterium]